MKTEEADELAKRIINSWHGGPPLRDWRETLDQLDAGTAGTTYVRLLRESENAPTIARFISTYRGLATPANQPTPPSNCRHCDGTGWVEAPDRIVGQADSSHRYSQVTACHACDTGRHAAELQARHWPPKDRTP